ncbi:MAG: hypothetical protein V3R86_04575 [Candidatus Hydrothermarchaeaceae archaeon]
MDVVKVGGSLLENARKVMGALIAYDVLIVPGGGAFADTVRSIQGKTGLGEKAAHKMAILAMDQYGLFLSDCSGLPAYSSIRDVKTPAVILPSVLLNSTDPFAPSWDVTSDTIACHIAKILGAERFIILKGVDGITVDGRVASEISARELQDLPETCVDLALPGYLLEYEMDCQIVNGMDKSAVERALNGEHVGTIVWGK